MKTIILIFLVGMEVSTLLSQPDWNVEANQFAFNMPVLTTAISSCATLGDQMAVFDENNVLRGVSSINNGNNTFFMTVYSNVTNNEILHFQYYDSESDEVFNLVEETFQFSSTGVIGIPDPFPVHTIESVKPKASCMIATIYLDKDGMAQLSTEMVDNESSDNCSVYELEINRSNFFCSDLGIQLVDLIITDASGNKDSCIAEITVLDTMPPAMQCQNVTVDLDESGNGSLTIAQVDGGTTDNCNISSMVLSKSTFTKFENRNQVIYYIVEDDSGNKDSCSVEVTITNDFENDVINCQDGIDNDGDGLTDCQEASCGMPLIQGVTNVNPTALSCTTTSADGLIQIEFSNADSFSIDGGLSYEATPTFNNLEAGEYDIMIQNNFAGCKAKEKLTLINTLSAAPPVADFEVKGPSVICRNSAGIQYAVDQPLNGSLTWSYTGSDVTMNSSSTSVVIDYGENTTSGMLTAIMSNACTSKSASVEVGIANSFLCSMFSNCISIVTVSNSLLENEAVSHVFQAGDKLISDAYLSGGDFQFSAGQSLEFNSGFTIDKKLSFTADIKTCSN